jgi:hypothetical protein
VRTRPRDPCSRTLTEASRLGETEEAAIQRWGSIALEEVLVAALDKVVWQAVRGPDTVYLGKPARLLVRSAVLGQGDRAKLCLHEAPRTADPVAEAQIGKELAQAASRESRTVRGYSQ